MVRLEELLLSLSHLDLQNEIVEKKAEVEGFGGSCDVFSAWSTKHDKSVAVKQLRAHLRMDVALAKRLAREMRIWAKLKHPNILPFLGFLVEGKNMVLSLISEWMENGTLYHFMKTFPRGGTIACIILRGIASGLDYLHSQNVFHADLKSANILISSFGTPLLADFGLSLAVSSTQSMSNPSSSSSGADTKGTVRWMAIELLPMNDEIPRQVPDKKSDVWAFGMIIYELLSWKKPYYTQTQDTLVVIAINNGARPTKPEEGSSSAVFDHLWSLAQICWHTDPSARPHTISLLSYLSMPSGSAFDTRSSYTRRRLWRKAIFLSIAIVKFRYSLLFAQQRRLTHPSLPSTFKLTSVPISDSYQISPSPTSSSSSIRSGIKFGAGPPLMKKTNISNARPCGFCMRRRIKCIRTDLYSPSLCRACYNEGYTKCESTVVGKRFRIWSQSNAEPMSILPP